MGFNSGFKGLNVTVSITQAVASKGFVELLYIDYMERQNQ